MNIVRRIAVALSGGVDSSVAAAQLVEKGVEVVGLTMCFNLPEADGPHPSCCGVRAIEDARRVAQALGIKHYVLNLQPQLEEKVIRDFVSEYALGRTPNPCVRCNQFVKFEALLAQAAALEASHLATGHYARIEQQGALSYIARAVDPRKDQSYFLYRATQQQMSRLLFPMGDYTKVQVRELAKRFNLPVAHKPDSQEICFLPDNDYRSFLRRMGYQPTPGPIKTVEGKIVGEHAGLAFYTIGQREGLRLAMGKPVYVVALDAATNTVVIGTREQASAREFIVREVHYAHEPFEGVNTFDVQIRYHHRPTPAQVTAGKDSLTVVCQEPQFAVTPGQSAVFYQQDRIWGGGIIEKALY